MPRLYLRTQSELLESIQDDVRDTKSDKWKQSEIYRALNRAIDSLGGEYIPVTTGNLTFSNSQTVTLAGDIISRTMQPEYSDTNSDLWKPVGTYDLDTDSDGNLVLRLPSVPGANVRLRYYVEQSPVPAVNTLPTLGSDLSSSATTMSLGASVRVAPSGFVKVGNEWIQYTAVDTTSSTSTLSGLHRGMYSTAGATHTSGDTVEWGIASFTQAGFEFLRLQSLAYLYAQLISPARSAETPHYQWQTQYYQQLADEKRPMALILPTKLPRMGTSYGQQMLGRSTGLRGDGVYH